MTALKITVNTEIKKSHINPEIYGSFAEHLGRCIYDGIYVKEDSDIPNINGIRKDVVEALKAINLPVLRWPGGCFADEYHWKDGIGEKSSRKRTINSTWGGVVDDNSFGTHEFFELCELIGCKPYIAGNVGSGTVAEMSEWLEYIGSTEQTTLTDQRKANGRLEPWKLKYFGIGNENWACGGNMRPEFYADLYRRYANYCKEHGGNRLYKIACGPNSFDYEWTDKLMANIGKDCAAISLHHYTWLTNRYATELTKEDYIKVVYKSRRMEELIIKHSEIMAKHDPEHKIKLVVDEWGTWYKVEAGTHPRFLHQQSTMTDAMVAASTLDIFNAHCDIVSMANIAQTVNVLQAVLLTKEEKIIKTPTYHVFDLYKRHQGNLLLESTCQNVVLENEVLDKDEIVYALSHSASVNVDGTVHITLSNADLDKEYEIDLELLGKKVTTIDAEILKSENYLSHNTYEETENVTVQKYKEVKKTANGISIKIPPCSVVALSIG